MTKSEKIEYLFKDSLGYWSVLGGAELKGIIYSINDYAIVVTNSWYRVSNKSVHKVKIYYGKRDYIIIRGYRLYFDECMRI